MTIDELRSLLTYARIDDERKGWLLCNGAAHIVDFQFDLDIATTAGAVTYRGEHNGRVHFGRKLDLHTWDELIKKRLLAAADNIDSYWRLYVNKRDAAHKEMARLRQIDAQFSLMLTTRRD